MLSKKGYKAFSKPKSPKTMASHTTNDRHKHSDKGTKKHSNDTASKDTDGDIVVYLDIATSTQHGT